VRRGEIWLVDLEPAVGSEAGKRRPAIIVSNDAANATASRLGRGVLTVVPVTSNVERIHPFQVELAASMTGLRVDSKAQAEQVRSIAFERFSRKAAEVPPDLMRRVDAALRLHLSL
jgi:mRNA interferase MazF